MFHSDATPGRISVREWTPGGTLSRTARIVASYGSSLLIVGAVFAQSVLRQGSEFQINQYTTFNQYHPSIAVDADGDFVVSWSSATQDGPGTPGIFAARFDSAGGRLGIEFQINAYTTGIQDYSSVASEASGDFVVVWQSYQQDGNLYGIFGRRFASDGTPLAGEFQVNAYTSNFQVQPEVASDSDGDFVVAWRSSLQDGAGFGVFARRYDSTGTPLATEFQVAARTLGNQANPSVSLEDNGDFVIAWESDGIDGSGNAVMARRFTSAGAALGPGDFQVNRFTNNNQARPAVAADADGDFVVAWQSLHQDGMVPYGNYGVFARRFDSNGVAQAGEFQINVYTTDYQQNPDVAIDDSGDFVVTWESRLQDGAVLGVFARRFTPNGVALGPELQVNSYTVGSQGAPPVIAFDNDGDFVIAWHTDQPQDGHYGGVFAQRFSLPPLATLDIDGNGVLDPLTDGLLHLRHRFGFSGDTLTIGAVAANCTRCDAASIAAYVSGLGLTLDIDDNGALDALTDGLLVLRFLFGFSGATLINNAVAGNCMTRCDAATITAYLQTLD
jgi:hypothetical protein